MEEAVHSNGGGRILVVILPWLGATEAAVEKYRKLYGTNEYEVIIHFTSVKDFLWPKSGLLTSLTVLDSIQNQLRAKKSICRIIVHAFSIGCYFYAIMIWQMRRNMELYGDIWRIISAQIMDSPVLGTTTEMAIGVSKMVSQRHVIASLCKNTCLLYFAMTKSYTTSYYEDFGAEIKYHAPDVPSLIMTSANDALCISRAFTDMCAVWQNSKFVVGKVWPDSIHTRHLIFHPDEYVALVRGIIDVPFRPSCVFLQSKL